MSKIIPFKPRHQVKPRALPKSDYREDYFGSVVDKYKNPPMITGIAVILALIIVGTGIPFMLALVFDVLYGAG